MRHLLTAIIVSITAIVLFMTVDWRDVDFSLTTHTLAEDSYGEQADAESDAEGDDLWIDTIMCAKGHSFGYSGDVSMWDGWYFDTIRVGDDIMLKYDSVGPSTLKLSLATREFIVDLGDVDVLGKIKSFLNPIDEFMRFQKSYEECLDSVIVEDYGTMRCMGYFSFTADYADPRKENAEKINRFVCDLVDISESERAKVPALSAMYAGFNPTKYYNPGYTGGVHDMTNLSDFAANRTFENWKRGGETNESSNGARLDIRSHIANSKFVTLSKFEYSRVGIGHGMYTETFHTLDLTSGKELSNKDIFKPNALDEVKMKLFEVMANDARYIEWNPEVKSSRDVEPRIKSWQSPDPLLNDTEWEEPEREFKFVLPEGALTDSGVVFSFQPYEIDCWAAGAYHFIVPYEKLKPYLKYRYGK